MGDLQVCGNVFGSASPAVFTVLRVLSLVHSFQLSCCDDSGKMASLSQCVHIKQVLFRSLQLHFCRAIFVYHLLMCLYCDSDRAVTA